MDRKASHSKVESRNHAHMAYVRGRRYRMKVERENGGMLLQKAARHGGGGRL